MYSIYEAFSRQFCYRCLIKQLNLERTPTIYQMMTFPSFPSQEKRYYSLMVNHELKKINDDDFLSTNGAEVCELVGTYLLILWKVIITKENQGF